MRGSSVKELSLCDSLSPLTHHTPHHFAMLTSISDNATEWQRLIGTPLSLPPSSLATPLTRGVSSLARLPGYFRCRPLERETMPSGRGSTPPGRASTHQSSSSSTERRRPAQGAHGESQHLGRDHVVVKIVGRSMQAKRGFVLCAGVCSHLGGRASESQNQRRRPSSGPRPRPNSYRQREKRQQRKHRSLDLSNARCVELTLL